MPWAAWGRSRKPWRRKPRPAACRCSPIARSREPIIEMLIPSLVDASLCPSNKHVASLFCQHANPQLPDGRSWDAVKEAVADLMLDTVNRHAPNFKASVIARRVLSPLDLEHE